jgi:curved DNA-binding protein CbpA
VLGVSVDADEGTVKRAYRNRIKDVHPDAEGGDEEAFKRVQRAYEVLTD